MRMLGLPAFVPPWYPLLKLPVNVVRSAVDLTLPGGMDRAARRGDRQQHALLSTMMGESDVAIGDSATSVNQVA